LDDLTVKERWPGETIENAESLDLKLLKPHRQLAKTLPGSMENRVADCGVGPDIAQLADTLFFPDADQPPQNHGPIEKPSDPG
jgi:hypothetical protein